MKRALSFILLSAMACGLLSGCSAIGSSGSDVLSTIPSMTLDEVAGSRLVASTNAEVESEIYRYLSDRIVVDGSKLIQVTDEDRANIIKLFANINTQLQGKGGDVLTPEYANYLLLELAKTPYEWSQGNVDIKGFDPAARLYFVDVTYSTIDESSNKSGLKYIVPDSKIPNGHPDGDAMKQKRYTDYITMLTAKFNGDTEKYPILYSNFINTWGDIDSIFDEQQGVSLYERTLKRGTETGGIGKLTYSGLAGGKNGLDAGATMTVRYVLKYALNLGEETDLTVEALYLKDYELKGYENLLKSYELTDTTSIEILKPFIDQLILSYNKCVEESNHIGLYQLFDNYATIDKYYDEIRDYTYHSIGGYNYQVLARDGKEVVVRVDRVYQVRARGAEMSLPTYQETLIFNILLGMDDTIYIHDIHLLKSELIGEPLSVIKNVSGISEQIQYSDVAFSATNEILVTDLIKNFSDVVANGDYSSEQFLKYVDLGISQNTLNLMAETIKAISPMKMHTYIVSWDTKTNVYCSVTVRQVFECKNGNFDTEAVIDMGNRNGEWKVVNYTRTVNIKTNNAIQDTTSALHTSENKSGGDVTEVVGTGGKQEVEEVKPVERPAETPSTTPEIVVPPEDETLTGDTSIVDEPIADVPIDEVLNEDIEESTTSSGSVDDFS